MTVEPDQYDFWRRRLAGEAIAIHDGECQAGFYRTRNRDRSGWRAVAYWFKDGKLRCRVDGSEIDEQRAMELWTYASKYPITHEVYNIVVQGGAWPDLHEAVTADRANSTGAADETSFDGLQDRITDLARDAERLIAAGAARTQDEVDRAADLANRLGELSRKADTARAAEKKPHDEAARAVQSKWLPLLGVADVYKRIKAAVITPFLVAEDQKRRAAEAEARREAERVAEENRKAAEAAVRAGEPVPEPSPEPVVSPPLAPVKAGSGSRRSVALRTVKDVVIEDRAAVLAFFADNQAITDVLQTSAERAVRAGVSVPGVKVIERQVAA
jgi:hypothetical protein